MPAGGAYTGTILPAPAASVLPRTARHTLPKLITNCPEKPIT